MDNDMKQYDYSFRVPLHHVDHAGVLFFANLFIHAHDAWETFMRSLHFDLAQLIDAGAWRIPIVHAEADYTQAMHHGDKCDIRLQVERLGRSSIKVVYIFIDEEGEQLAVARTTHVFIDTLTGSSVEIPGDLRDQFQNYVIDPCKVS